ncbi:MAG: hypothetical protein JWL62_2326 [Hyphomicrobiales bacterium]|nr:hypothetical protein [Hyphomicrobiales bacterium]
MKRMHAAVIRGVLGAGVLCAVLVAAPSVFAGTIIAEWANVKPPAAPELKPVKIDPKTTAFLVLDLVKQICNPSKSPRCVDSIPAVQKFLTLARANNVPVVFSLIPGTKVGDIMDGLVPMAADPVVQGGPEKFIGTDLEKILKDKGITSVIVVGTSAFGAVLYTASGATLRGFKAIVPVEGMSGDNLYDEQVGAYTLARAPVVSLGVTLTSFDKISF